MLRSTTLKILYWTWKISGGELEQSSRKQTGRPRNISVLSAMSVRNILRRAAWLGLDCWAAYLPLYDSVRGQICQFISHIFKKNKPWQRPNWRPNGIPCGDIWKNRSGRLTALGLVHSQGRGWPIIVINGGLIRVLLLNHQQHCSFFFSNSMPSAPYQRMSVWWVDRQYLS